MLEARRLEFVINFLSKWKNKKKKSDSVCCFLKHCRICELKWRVLSEMIHLATSFIPEPSQVTKLTFVSINSLQVSNVVSLDYSFLSIKFYQGVGCFNL